MFRLLKPVHWTEEVLTELLEDFRPSEAAGFSMKVADGR